LQRIHLGAQFGHYLAVDLNTALADQFLAVAPATNACGGEHLLKTLRTGHLIRCVAVFIILRAIAARGSGGRHDNISFG
jgi:hypothetical protein